MTGLTTILLYITVVSVLTTIVLAVARKNVASMLESFAYFLGSQVSLGDTALACDWRAPIATKEAEPATVMYLKSGSLVSFVEILGVCRYMGDKEFATLSHNLGEILASRMKNGNGQNHSFQFCFRGDASGSGRIAEELIGPMVATAKRLGITDVSFFDARKKQIAESCSDESVYLAVFTHRAGMSANEVRNAAERSQKASAELAKNKVRITYDDMFAQSALQAPKMLVTRHTAVVENLMKDLGGELEKGGAYLLTSLLDVGEASNMVRRVFDHSTFPASWRPRFFGGQGITAASTIDRKGDEASRMPVSLARQMINQSLHEKFGAFEYAQHGRWLSASLMVEVLPEDGSKPFNELMDKLGRAVPLAYMLDVLPQGFNFRKADQIWGSFMAAMGDTNRDIKRGWDELKLLERGGHYIAATRILMTTWAPNEADLQDNIEFLRSSVESWGSATCSNETGEPALAAIATAAGYSRGCPAPYLPAPATDIARMAPVVRSASVWKRGHLVATTLEGRPYPIMMGSPLQNSWASVGFAPPGSGKSFFMNLMNSGLLMAPGAQEIPYITVVDVGPSSKLIMDWYRSMLPPEKRHQVVSIRVRNTPEFAINPLDTFLGFDMPTEQDVDYASAVLGTIAPGLGDESGNFFRKIIMAAYARFARDSVNAKLWQPALDEDVTAAIERFRIPFEEGKTRVWDVVDALFDHGAYAVAEKAQVYAMPILMDLSKVISQAEITLPYGNAKAVRGELMLDVFQRNLSDAMTGAYKLISGYTKANVGAARAISIDLEEVVGSTSSEDGVRRSALMFLFARRLGARNFFARWDEIKATCPDRYKRYQEDRVSKMWEQMKFLEYDEIHYASGAAAFSRLLEADLRVGRKFNMNVMMMSQLVTDFPKQIMANAANFFIFSLGDDEKMAAEVQAAFGLSASEMSAIRKYCRTPGTLYARFVTSKGTLAQVLRTTASPLERWAFTTTAADAPVRATMAAKLGGGDEGYRRSVNLLGRLLPDGSAKPMIEKIKAQMSEDSHTEDTMATIVCDKLLERAMREDVEV